MDMGYATSQQYIFEIKIRFFDRNADVNIERSTLSSITWPDFLVMLHELTTEVAHAITDVIPQRQIGQGFSLADGDWWYRIRPARDLRWRARMGRWNSAPHQPQFEWPDRMRVLSSADGFGKMMADVAEKTWTGDVWIEIQHKCQRDRDMNIRSETHGPLIVNGSEGYGQNRSPGVGSIQQANVGSWLLCAGLETPIAAEHLAPFPMGVSQNQVRNPYSNDPPHIHINTQLGPYGTVTSEVEGFEGSRREVEQVAPAAFSTLPARVQQDQDLASQDCQPRARRRFISRVLNQDGTGIRFGEADWIESLNLADIDTPIAERE